MAKRRGVGVGGTTYMSIDVETYERGGEVLEVGIAWICASEVWPAPKIHCRHFIVEDHLLLSNGKFVPDNRTKFNFGQSEYVAERDLYWHITELIDPILISGQRLYVAGHTINQDIRWLKGVGVELELGDVTFCDIGLAYQASRGAHQLTKLERMLHSFDIPGENLHNGANDAYYSLRVCLEMMATEERKRYEDEGLL
jgi:hypothetical protein